MGIASVLHFITEGQCPGKVEFDEVEMSVFSNA